MKQKAKLIVMVVLIGMFGLAGFADASPSMVPEEEGMKAAYEQKKGNGEFKKNKDWKVDKEKFKAKIKEELGLTDEQQQKLEEHRKVHREQAKLYKKSIEDLREQLKKELEKEDFDREKVQGLHEQLKSLINQKEDHRLQGILDVREILTAEQFRKFHEFKDRKKEKRDGKWEYYKKGKKDLKSENKE